MHRALLLLAMSACVALPANAVDTATLSSLLQRAGVEHEVDGDRLHVVYRLESGRRQAVFLAPMAPLVDGVDVVEIYSPVQRLTADLPAAVAGQLLEANGTQKVAYFGVEEVEGAWWLLCYHNLPLDAITPKALAAVMQAVAAAADDMERLLGDGGADEL
ncbi:MAG TPA: hypothetical protein VMT16_16295 [Thermoanaerobaculia bacterium]|nr:hypothetical protein [Thermoanaerobaculia bacterium]